MADKNITSEKDDLSLKLILEAAIISSFGKLFNEIVRDYRTIYTATSQVLDAGVYRDDVTKILKRTYHDAGKTSGKEIRDNVEILYTSDNQEQVEGNIEGNLSLFSDKEADSSALVIEETTNRQLRNLTLGAIIASALLGIFPSSEEIAKAVSSQFIFLSKTRRQIIAINESLNAVEGSRLIEANTLLDGNVSIKVKKESKPLMGSLFRDWITRLDKKVRFTHALAHGQRVFGTKTPFVVGGSLLMYPGDASLGASAKEIIGCRCYASTGIIT